MTIKTYPNLTNTQIAYIRASIPNIETSDLVLDMMNQFAQGGGGGGGTGEPGGPVNSIQTHGAGDTFYGSSNFTYNPITNEFKVGNQVKSGLMTPSPINNGQLTPANLAVFDATFKFYSLVYSIERGSQTRIGWMLICHNGSMAAIIENSGDTGAGVSDEDIMFSATLLSGNLYLQYTSNDTGNSGTFKYSVERW